MIANMNSNIAPGDLARFLDAFARAVMDPISEPDVQVEALVAQPAFALYRNTVMKGCIDALQANYPTVTKLVGDEWMRAAAAIYARETPPTEPTLLRYGSSFADFLARFEPAADLPYLPGVAQLDRFWIEAHLAPDEELLDATPIARLTPDALAATALHPHAATRWIWFAEAPVFTIWSRNRGNEVSAGNSDWKPEGALLVRPRDTVQWIEIDAGACAFLDECAAGRSVAAAANAALEVKSDCDLTRLMSTLLAAGAFSGMTIQPAISETA